MYNVFSDGDEVGICKAEPFIGKTIIAPPGVAATQTFMCVGAFDTRQEAEACDKYINSKFAQAMLSLKKYMRGVKVNGTAK